MQSMQMQLRQVMGCQTTASEIMTGANEFKDKPWRTCLQVILLRWPFHSVRS